MFGAVRRCIEFFMSLVVFFLIEESLILSLGTLFLLAVEQRLRRRENGGGNQLLR